MLGILTGGTSGMTDIMGQTTNLTTVMGDVFTLIASNAYLAFFAAVGLIAAGVHVFRLIKGAAR